MTLCQTEMENNMGFGSKREGRPPRKGMDEYVPLEVWVEGDNLGRAMSQLKRKMAAEGVFKELKRRRYHEKPSERRKRRIREAARRRRKALRARTRPERIH